MPPEITVDDEVYAAMADEAVPFVDEPNDVLRRKFGLPARNGTGPASGGAGSGQDTTDDRRAAPRAATGMAARKRGRRRAPRGQLLPESDYEAPILKVLHDRGDEAPAREATDAVEPLIADQLTALDRERTASGEVRWRNRTQFARLALANRGLIDKTAPRGIWRLTEAGRETAKKVKL